MLTAVTSTQLSDRFDMLSDRFGTFSEIDNYISELFQRFYIFGI
jgi:hypothetical protein